METRTLQQGQDNRKGAADTTFPYSKPILQTSSLFVMLAGGFPIQWPSQVTLLIISSSIVFTLYLKNTPHYFLIRQINTHD